MSAWMVSKEHIDLLVDVAITGPRSDRAVSPDSAWHRVSWRRDSEDWRSGVQLGSDVTPDELGEMLTLENLRSINYRYPDTFGNAEDTPRDGEVFWPEPYRFERHGYTMTPAEALNAIDCYEYQACEHPEWNESEAKRFCEALRSALISCIPGWRDAPWGWNSEKIAAAKQALYV